MLRDFPFQEANFNLTLSAKGWRNLSLGAPIKIGTPK